MKNRASISGTEIKKMKTSHDKCMEKYYNGTIEPFELKKIDDWDALSSNGKIYRAFEIPFHRINDMLSFHLENRCSFRPKSFQQNLEEMNTYSTEHQKNSIRKLSNSISELGFIPQMHCTVKLDGNKLILLDGNRRAWAAFQKKQSVWVMFDRSNRSPQFFSRCGESQKKWTTTDFAVSYCYIPDYKYLLDFYKKNSNYMSMNSSIMLFLDKPYGFNNDTKKSFSDGEFKINCKKNGRYYAKLLKDIDKITYKGKKVHPNVKNKSFLEALMRCVQSGKYDHMKILRNMRAKPCCYMKCRGSVKNYMMAMQNIQGDVDFLSLYDSRPKNMIH